MGVVVRWLDRLEGSCGPVPAWALAVALVAAGLPVVLAWRLLVACARAAAARARALHGAVRGPADRDAIELDGNAP
jgi:hypothetical protein